MYRRMPDDVAMDDEEPLSDTAEQAPMDDGDTEASSYDDSEDYSGDDDDDDDYYSGDDDDSEGDY